MFATSIGGGTRDAVLAESNSSLPPWDDLKSHLWADCLYIWVQLRAQRLATSMGELHLFLFTIIKTYTSPGIPYMGNLKIRNVTDFNNIHYILLP